MTELRDYVTTGMLAKETGIQYGTLLARMRKFNIDTYTVGKIIFIRRRDAKKITYPLKKPGPRKHGMTGTPVYAIWQAMMGRCYNENNPVFKYYGLRGIRVCPRWHRFENFLQDMGEPPDGHSIDRKDGNRNYTKRNCRWATQQEQLANRRNVQ